MCCCVVGVIHRFSPICVNCLSFPPTPPQASPQKGKLPKALPSSCNCFFICMLALILISSSSSSSLQVPSSNPQQPHSSPSIPHRDHPQSPQKKLKFPDLSRIHVYLPLSLNPLYLSTLRVFSVCQLYSLSSLSRKGIQAGRPTAQNAEAQDTCMREEHGRHKSEA